MAMADRRVAAIRRFGSLIVRTSLGSFRPRGVLVATSGTPWVPSTTKAKGLHVPIVHFTFPCTVDSPGIRND